jgi:FtsP/CotA-like multicopper oxidase with cupredoxin domain
MSKKESNFTRRRFIQVGGLAGAGMMLPWQGSRLAMAQLGGQIALSSNKIPQFADSLPILTVSGGTMDTVIAGGDTIELTMCEFQASVLPTGTLAPGVKPATWVWGYRRTLPTAMPDTYLGPVIVATRGIPTQIKYINALGTAAGTNVLAYKNSTDQTLDWADPPNESNACYAAIQPGLTPTGICAQNYLGPIPTVPHLHGGEVPPMLDGGPDAWFTSYLSTGYRGHAYYTRPGVAVTINEAVYRYPNAQEAAPAWFHDHALGVTRLNVYAGLAGAYPIIDPGLTLPSGLHPVGLDRSGVVDYTVPLVIQDRMFDINGQLFFPNVGINPEHPFWIPEFVGDTILVNGKVWPFFNVQAKRYRFLFLNGSNARTYELYLINKATGIKGPAMWQIGTDGGYLDAPVKIDPNVKPLDRLLIMPGERADVIIDFAGLAPGTKLLLANTAKTPYPVGEPASGRTTGRIMEFRVLAGAAVTDASYNPNPATGGGAPLRPTPMIRLVNPTIGTLATGVTPDVTRRLTLNEVIGPGGPLEILVNNTKYDGKNPYGEPRSDFATVTVNGNTTYYSEVPAEGTTEVWEVINLTADAHPIHTHLTQVQLINRQAFNVKNYTAAYDASFLGGIEKSTGVVFLPGVYMPGYGPPLNYVTPITGVIGGNPDVAPFLVGAPLPPAANEAGWKDTIRMNPGEVTRIAVRFAPTDKAIGAAAGLYYPFNPDGNSIGIHGYVWHCHIIDHEDNEMMRPTSVTANSNAVRTFTQGTDY